MFVIVRSYTGAGSADDMSRHAQQDVVPMLKEQSGFRSFFFLEADDGSLVSMSAFEDREAALAANERVVSWVEETLSDLVPTPPKITFGEVLFPELAAKPSGGGSPYIDIVTYDGITQPPESLAPKAREHVIPVLKRQSGFLGMYHFRTETNPDRSVTVGIFDRKEAADEAHALTSGLMQGKFKDIFPNPPKRIGGRALIAMAG